MKYREAVLKTYVTTTFAGVDQSAGSLGARNRQLAFFKHNYKKLLPSDHTAKIFELGPGRGEFLEFLKSEGYQNIAGIDGSPEVAQTCQSKGFAITHAADFTKHLSAPENQNRFDAVIANDILEHFTKPELFDLLQAIFGALKNNGKLIAKVPNASCLIGAASRYWDITHETSFTENSARQIVLASGFKSFQAYEPHLYCFYANPLNYIGWLAYSILKLKQLLIHKLNGNFGVHLVSNNLIFVAGK